MISVTLLALVAGLAAAEPIQVTGVEQSQTIACGGRGVVVNGVDHDLTFTGGCAGLQLTGSGSKVAIDLKPGATVVVTGTDQTVRWRSSAAPRVSVTGVGNKVSKAP